MVAAALEQLASRRPLLLHPHDRKLVEKFTTATSRKNNNSILFEVIASKTCVEGLTSNHLNVRQVIFD